MASKKPLSTVKYWAPRFECPVDEDAGYHNTFWCNRELIPIPPDRRTWTWQGYAGYWVIAGINTTAWTVVSSLLSLGLSARQAIGVTVGASILTAVIAILAGWPGSHQHIGFTVLCRASWGMRGGFWPVLNRIVTGIVWLGIQMYWGGQAVKIVLGAIVGPSWVGLRNTLPAGANVDTASLISFFVFQALFLPCLLMPPERLQIPFRITFIMVTCTVVLAEVATSLGHFGQHHCTMFGILGWAIFTNNGTGPLLNTPSTTRGASLSWASLYGVQSLVGSLASGALGQSDWTHYAKTPNAALFGQTLMAPIAISVTAVCGLLITAATAEIYGQYPWNPYELLLHVQETSLTPGARAGTFFAGVASLCSQLALCIVLNGVSAAIDLAALSPKWINIRRGGYFVSILAITICPWNYVTKPTTFITVLSRWSVFLGPMTGILMADYFLIRKRKYHLGEL